MNEARLTEPTKKVLRLAVKQIAQMPLEQRAVYWQGICDLAPEETALGALARQNLLLVRQTLLLQDDFLEALNIQK